jgi:hypothetical protein
MKKQGAPDPKRAVANDKPENAKAAKVKKSSKAADDAKYVIGNPASVKRGCLLARVEFAKAKGTVGLSRSFTEIILCFVPKEGIRSTGN